MVSLSQLPIFMPKLRVLDLSGSILNSIRDLGYGLIHLNTLNVSNCGLSSLDGTNAITSLHTLIADDNRIESINPLGNLILLQKLSLKNNRIQTIEILSFLALCPLIKNINLEGNLVTNLPTYRKDMKKNITTLEILDDLDINNDDNNYLDINNVVNIQESSSLSEEASSLSEEIDDIKSGNNSENDKIILNNLELKERPSTSDGRYHHATIREKIPTRPGTSGYYNCKTTTTYIFL